ncbi:DUF4998 domain-containing protein [Arcticibacter tournemirensis]|uniref:F5/8 type C domain-containing protein n=1 Tax=Arcticibacter tournemirensis TaxID=699437 RepID=A0A4Q0ME49_9SPHI|nr:DUF4998 domain-containing protein [Arcticibacter tournemirensis]RXF71698.1 hypothetical protein EKH83_03145 [Arcticibacter tournemirensis]
MKKIFSNTMMIVVLFLAFCALPGCTKMDSTYKEFVIPGGLTYAGKANSPKVYPGFNRVKIAWVRGSDPDVISARVFWNNFRDSTVVPIPPTGDTISVIIDNLQEKSYSFVIRTYDKKGNSSIPVEAIGGSYGEKYQSQLLTRPVNSTLSDTKGKITIQWGAADISNGAFASEVKYTDVNGDIRYQMFPTDLPTSEITGLKPNTGYQYRTMFKPDSLSIYSFYTAYSEAGFFNFDKKDWRVISYSDQYSDGDNAAANIIDGTDGTRWHTNGSAYPHYATIDMGAVRTISQFGVWRTLFDTPNGDDRAPTRIEFLISMDNQNWTSLGEYAFNNSINGEQVFPISGSPKGRYFKFVGLRGNNHFMTLGEISAYGF